MKNPTYYKQRTYEHAAIWIGAGIVGLAAVLYARLVTVTQNHYFKNFDQHPIVMIFLSPLFFVLATGLVRKIAPDAKGSGIPQVLEAIEQNGDRAGEATEKKGLTSVRTAIVKVISSAVGIFGGASIGREGPTVQVAASVFALVGKITKKWVPNLSPQSFLIAGASAGVAAAFNTPIAGISFAIEELADGAFGPFKQTVMLAIVISGITAQALLGDYLYFGHPAVGKPNLFLISEVLLLGVLGGLLGSLFAKLLAFPKLTRLPERWWPRAALCGLLCGLIGYYTNGATAGSGYETTQSALSSSSLESANLLFPFWKIVTTVLSYLSGMAGGIFSPSLSIGAGLGLTVAKLVHFADFKVCALLGMTAFFSGVVQAPLTAVIIVTEMTDEHTIILPLMATAFISHAIGKLLMPVPLYRLLAQRNEEA